MAAIGVSPGRPGRHRASSSAVPDFAAGWVTDRDVIEQIFEAVDVVVRALRPRIEETEKTDLVTQDLLIALVGELEEARWMWQAQNVGYQRRRYRAPDARPPVGHTQMCVTGRPAPDQDECTARRRGTSGRSCCPIPATSAGTTVLDHRDQDGGLRPIGAGDLVG